MSTYLDTSVLVSAITREPASARAWAFLDRVRIDCSISAWVRTEFASALSLKLRTRAIGLDERDRFMAGFREFEKQSLACEAIYERHFMLAARFAEHHALGLRAGDALHLAIASDRGLTLATLDMRLANAGVELGTATALL